MSVIILILAFSLIVSGGFLLFFIWNVKQGQFDDMEGPKHRILFEEKNNNNKK